MVLMAAKLSSMVYEMFNDKAEPVGEIRLPLNTAIIGLGRGTVYLDRPMPAVRLVDPAA
jgi:hypothetical protein